MSLRDDFVRALEAENDELRDRLAMLEELVGLRIKAPLQFGLTAHEAGLFGLLFRNEMVRRDLVMMSLYPHEQDRPEIKIVDVYVCKLRRKLSRYGIEIETIWGQGFRMPPSAKDRVKTFIETEIAA